MCRIFFPFGKCFLFALLSSISLNSIAQPTISSFSPAFGTAGSNVTIAGTNFSATMSANTVFFGAAKATVTAASATSLTVTVPAGATYAPITVTVNNLVAYSSGLFRLTFPNGGFINAGSFGPQQDFSTGIRPNAISVADFDGDGLTDIATPNNHSVGGFASVSVLRNISSGGAISFGPKLDLTTGAGTYGIASGDIDGDGKPEIVSSSNFDSKISVFRNTGTSGTISFAPKVEFGTGSAPFGIAIGDIDGDGKPDIVVINDLSSVLSVYRNTGAVGTISFAAKVDFPTLLQPEAIVLGDFDGDNKADIAFTNKSSGSFSVYRNTSTAGNISLATRVDVSVGSGNQPYGLATGDIENDSKLDIAVVINNGSGGGLHLFRNTGSPGTISLVSNTLIPSGSSSNTCYHVGISDINGDGKVDVAMTLGGSSLIKVYQNNTSGAIYNLSAAENFTSSFAPYGIALADFEGDSKPDLAISEFTLEKISVYKSRSGLPNISSFTPTTAGTGVTVIISGDHFTGATSVTFGGVPAASFSVINSGQINAVVGSGASGNVVVTTAQGSGSKSGFTFAAPPVISSFAPTAAGAGTTVTITGANFTGTTAVSFGGTAASSFNVVNNTTITAVVGSGASGLVSVTNTFGTGTLAGFTFIPAPTITSFTPTTGGSGTIVAITGTNFLNASAVTFGGVPAASFIVNSATSITATVANGGTGNVSVTTPGGTGSLALFIYPPPAILTINPVTANTGATVTITGTGFSSTPSNNTVFFGQVRGIVQTASPTQLTVTVPIGAAYGPVSVTLDNITAYSSQHFVPSFAGGAPLAANSLVSVFDSIMPNLVTKFILADYDGDAKPDLGFTSADFKVFRNLSTVNTIALAPRQQFTLGTAPFGGAVGDFNGDGKPDVVASNFTSLEINVLRNISTLGTINFAPTVNLSVSSGQPTEVVVTDIDKDGKPDIVVAVRNPNKIVVFRNTTVGNNLSFISTTITVTALPYVMVSADIDGDMKPDLAYVDGNTTSLYILRNTSAIGSVSFAGIVDATLPGILTTLAAGDIDNDGKPEMVTTSSAFAYVLANTSSPGNINFGAATILLIDNNPGAIAIADIEGDGKPDLLSSGDGKTCVLRNTSTTGTISFEAKRSYDGWNYVIGTIDLNGDSKTDVVTSNSFGSGRVMYVKNQVGGPVITSFSPASGFTGNTITISGTGFTGATAVSFGGTPAASFTVVNSTTITAVIAAGSSGNVEVVTPGGTAIKSGFTYIGAPLITSFTPATATTNNNVVITGTDFTGATAVSFGGVPATSFGIVSSTTINATVGTGASGNVSVTTPAGTGTKAGFTYVGAPAITSFSPTSATSGTTVTITGVNFLTVSNVSFGGTSASSFVHVNSTTITAVVGPGSSGFVTVSSTNGPAVLAGFTFLAPPFISSFTPTTGATGTVVTITGTNFTNASAVSFGGIAASSFTVVNPTTITAVVAGGASGNVSVTTPIGTANSAGFTYNIVTAIGGPNGGSSPELTVSPNPGVDVVYITHPSSTKTTYLQIIDVNGRTVRTIRIARNQTQTSMSVKGFASGIYQLIWSDGKKKYRRTLMVSL